jgi:uncharacterized protein YndB with AHSA1/START domain
MSETREASSTQVYRVYIKATPERVWDAITKPEWTDRFGYGGKTDYDLRPGAAYQTHPSDAMIKAGAEMGIPVPDTIVDGEVIEADPPRRLVLTWRMLMDTTGALAAEGFSRLTYEIEAAAGATRLTVVHELPGPLLAAMVAGENESSGAGGGWPWVLSDLKSLLETGSTLAGAAVA